jgi:hypothetical protein
MPENRMNVRDLLIYPEIHSLCSGITPSQSDNLRIDSQSIYSNTGKERMQQIEYGFARILIF